MRHLLLGLLLSANSLLAIGGGKQPPQVDNTSSPREQRFNVRYGNVQFTFTAEGVSASTVTASSATLSNASISQLTWADGTVQTSSPTSGGGVQAGDTTTWTGQSTFERENQDAKIIQMASPGNSAYCGYQVTRPDFFVSDWATIATNDSAYFCSSNGALIDYCSGGNPLVTTTECTESLGQICNFIPDQCAFKNTNNYQRDNQEMWELGLSTNDIVSDDPNVSVEARAYEPLRLHNFAAPVAGTPFEYPLSVDGFTGYTAIGRGLLNTSQYRAVLDIGGDLFADGEIHSEAHMTASTFTASSLVSAPSANLNNINPLSGTEVSLTSNTHVNIFGHYEVSGSTPLVTSCGTSPTITGVDMVGKVTVGTVPGASCTLTFASTWTNAPSCMVTNEATANLTRASSTSSQVVFSGTLLGGDVLAYICLGRR